MSMPAETLNPGMTLAELLAGVDGLPDVAVHGIASDSRRVGPGFLFLATPGANSHGLTFAEQAIERGAAAIAYDPAGAPEAVTSLPIPVIPVPGLADRLGEIANRFYAEPSAALDVFGITGTNGKTTVAWLLARCARTLGTRCGYIGTLGAGIDAITTEHGLTTPGTVEMHGMLADFRDRGASAAAVEVSSHALDQKRVAGVQLRAALFTNLSRDHLDYHGSMQAYFEAKAKLFLEHAPKAKIINVDSEYGNELANRCGDDVITVSTRFDRVANGRPYVFVRSVVATEGGSTVRVDTAWGSAEFTLSMPGDFNVANAVLVMATLLNEGFGLDAVARALSAADAPPGRLDRVPGEGPRVYVDFAHTPEALEFVLKALRPHVRGRLAVVFGAGGDRDPGKRPFMGRVAERLADRVVLTSDNPRSEEPLEIIEAIRAGMLKPEGAVVIGDRAAAIAWAIADATPGDTVLVAGKGHEAFQDIGGEKRPFADMAVAAACLAAPARRTR